MNVILNKLFLYFIPKQLLKELVLSLSRTCSIFLLKTIIVLLLKYVHYFTHWYDIFLDYKGRFQKVLPIFVNGVTAANPRTCSCAESMTLGHWLHADTMHFIVLKMYWFDTTSMHLYIRHKCLVSQHCMLESDFLCVTWRHWQCCFEYFLFCMRMRIKILSKHGVYEYIFQSLQ